MMSRRIAILPSDSDDEETSSYDDELSDDHGSPSKTFDDSTVMGVGISNSIVELSKDFAGTKLEQTNDDDESSSASSLSHNWERDKPIKRKPPFGRNHPSLYDTSSDEDNDDDVANESVSSADDVQQDKPTRSKGPPGGRIRPSLDDSSSYDDEDDHSEYENVSSSVDGVPPASAPKTNTFAFRREYVNGDSTPSANYRAPSVAEATVLSTKHPLRPQLGYRRDRTSSLGDDSSSACSDDDIVIPKKAPMGNKSTNTLDHIWSFDKIRKEYTMTGGTEEKCPPFSIPSELYDKLYDFQREGVTWMARLHEGKIGGVLGDDMGMGKTFTTLSLIGGLMRAKSIRKALVVAPVSVLRNWENEAHKIVKLCVRNARIQVISSDSVKGHLRKKRLHEALESQSCQLVITSYGLVTSVPDDFTHKNRNIFWDYVILDEAHRIKNPSTKVSINVEAISRKENTRRIILSGTPIMNNLQELHALFNYATSGKVLGTHKEFQTIYGRPIETARSADADKNEIEAGEQAMAELQRKIGPYLLQRLKKDHLADKLPKKRDYVLWTNLSSVQRRRYSDYVQSKDSAIADYFRGTVTSPLFAITWLQKLCGHPLLATDDSSLPDDDEEGRPFVELEYRDPNELLRDSAKLQVLNDLMDFLHKKRHRTLIFSQSTKVLDIIHCVLKNRFNLSRIDGKTKEKDRQKFVDEFNRKGSHLDAMLVSTKAGGQGLTLTGADTCIMYDPSWNPAEDSQAVDRVYRIGQDKEVTVFRLITAGTVEEKRYEKQIHKDGIRRAVFTNTGSDTTKYFTKEELIRKKVFVLGEEGECEFLSKLEKRGQSFDEDENPEYSFTWHVGVVGQSSHDILYSIEDWYADTKKGGDSSLAHPFSSPTKPDKWLQAEGRAMKPSSPQRKVMGKAQRVLARGDHHVQKGREEKENKRTVENIPAINKTMAKTRPVGFISKHKLDEILARIERHGATRQVGKAHELAMDLLQGLYGAIPEDEKDGVHRRIASVSHASGWL